MYGTTTKAQCYLSLNNPGAIRPFTVAVRAHPPPKAARLVLSGSSLADRSGRARASPVSQRACRPRDAPVLIRSPVLPSPPAYHHPPIHPSGESITERDIAEPIRKALLVWLRPWPRSGATRIRNPSKSRAPTRSAPRQSVFSGVLAKPFPLEIANHWHTAGDKHSPLADMAAQA